MSSTEPHPYVPYGELLLNTARESVRYGLIHAVPLTLNIESYPSLLQDPEASFVTLHQLGHLRGCIGSLEPTQPLIIDVSNNAFSAAFRDPRFSPLCDEDLDNLDIHISILGPLEPLICANNSELLRRIVPYHDGIVLIDEPRRSTFLPSVWESLPDPAEFLHQLKHKAGMPADYWSPTLKVFRYSVYDIP